MRTGRFRQGGAHGGSLAQSLPEYLDTTIYVLLLLCLSFVTFALSFKTHNPFDAIKEMLFHFFVLLSFFFFVVRAVLTGTVPVRKSVLNLFVVLYLACNAVSFVTSQYVDRSYFVDLVLLVVFFFSIGEVVNTDKKYVFLLYIIALIVLVCSIYGLIQFLGLDFKQFQDPIGNSPFGDRVLGVRVFVFFGNPNFYAASLAMCLPLLLSGFFSREGPEKHVFTVAIILGGASLLQTGSRAALLGAVISLILFFAITYGEAGRNKFLGLTCLVVVLCGVGFLFSATLEDAGFRPLQHRRYLWQNTLEIAQDHSLMGSGVGSFNVYYPAYRTQSVAMNLGAFNHETRTAHAHNEFLEILSDLGILGFLLFSGIILSFIYDCYGRWDSERKYIIAGSVCAVVGILINNLFSVNLRVVFVAMFFWLCLALPSALKKQREGSLRATFSLGRVMGCLLPLPLMVTFFLNHSLGRYRTDVDFKKGLTLYNQGSYRQAEADFERALESNPESKWTLYFQGMAQSRLGKYEKSKRTFLELTQLDPNFLQVHYWLGNNYYSLGDFENAKKEYDESLKLNDVYGPSYYSLAFISLQENNVEQALSYLDQAYTAKSDGTTENIRIKALEKLIEVNQLIGNSEKARAYADRLRELKRGDTTG